MSNLWVLYWVTRLDSIISFLDGAQFLLLFGSAIMMFVAAGVTFLGNEKEKVEYKWTKKLTIWVIVFLLLVSFIKTLIPTKQDALLIMAGVAVTEVVQSESAKRIAGESVSVIEAWLDKQQRELKKEQEK